MPKKDDDTYLFDGVKIIGNFWCYENNLKSLEGSPKIILGCFHVGRNELESLEGAPSKVTGDFWCYGNDKQFTEAYVRSICKVGGTVYVT